ncbi:hypothetical protein GN956_G14729 [Arapaima gigas]
MVHSRTGKRSPQILVPHVRKQDEWPLLRCGKQEASRQTEADRLRPADTPGSHSLSPTRETREGSSAAVMPVLLGPGRSASCRTFPEP